jgi:hypothetical protein
MDKMISRAMLERALANAKASVDFEARFLTDLREQMDEHRAKLDMYRSDVKSLGKAVHEAED